MLEQTQTLFTGGSDDPCSGADRLAPKDSEANPRCSADSLTGPFLPDGSRAPLPSHGSSGTVLPTSAVPEADPWLPPEERETCTSRASLPRMTKDWRRREEVFASISCGALGVNTTSLTLPQTNASAGSS